MRQLGSSTEQNYRRIRNKFNGDTRKLQQNGGLVYPAQPPKSAPLPRKMYPNQQIPGDHLDNPGNAMVAASSVNDLRFLQHQGIARSPNCRAT